jgi:hypothetical protein
VGTLLEVIMTTTSHQQIEDGTILQFGIERFTFGKEVVELTDSSGALDDTAELHARMVRDGYLFLRGFHPRDLAERAAGRTLAAIGASSDLAPGTDAARGICGPGEKSYSFFRDVAVAHSPEVLDVVDGAHTFEFFRRFLGGPVLTFDKRWLRAIASGGHNHFHYDSAYVGRGTPRRYTMWSAFSDINLENGPLVICLGSHLHEKLKNTYGQIDMDRDLIDPVFSTDPREMVERFGFKLATAHFEPGDCILFGLHLLHSSIPNRSNRFRISIDTRYQLASEPSDERFHGPRGSWLGNFYNRGATYRPMRELRAQWGV